MCVQLHPWFALHDDTVHADMALGRILPIRRCGGAKPGDVFEGDDRFTVTDALGGELNPGHLAGLHRHHCAVNALWREPAFDALPHFVEFDVEIVRQTAHLTTPHRNNDSRLEHRRRVVVRSGSETHSGP
jgi:hypothetical protein